jgi:hypothetical protein
MKVHVHLHCEEHKNYARKEVAIKI